MQLGPHPLPQHIALKLLRSKGETLSGNTSCRIGDLEFGGEGKTATRTTIVRSNAFHLGFRINQHIVSKCSGYYS